MPLTRRFYALSRLLPESISATRTTSESRNRPNSTLFLEIISQKKRLSHYPYGLHTTIKKASSLSVAADLESAMSASKKRRIDDCLDSEMTTRSKAFKKARFAYNCLVSPLQALLPNPLEDIRKFYVRKCYGEVFDMLVTGIEKGFRFFAITGTPGTGKSFFFTYMLHRLMKHRSGNSSQRRPRSFNPTRVVFQNTTDYYCFD
ncbi:hypothetical protein BJ741DRAFT_608305 [Chytriomyces cf. hyalinus JEL632]|nr:hypothetical protein BJ741DRAFT_608305 [Chytriomyces cf. hyalinus JEL632]